MKPPKTTPLAEDTGGRPEAVAAIDEAAFEKNLYTCGLPDVDLVIRTGGARRLSNFLPWQCAYAELYFTETFWPDFDEAELDKALDFFAKTKRNFGT
ncbi:MAG: undecaprenyl diphosphate synthase family protein [Candidatus Sungbacteria bacterium]|nr:undecaprenyl diphosphate synthase family protein [Candidatus Sungbacteria bacterium]